MAVTIDELLVDIEKRMIALGYDNFEELYNPNHDIKSLKDLKRRIMDEAKLQKELKKENTKYTKSLRDLLVKLTKLYKKDTYIYNGIYAIPGKTSEESLKGGFIISIKDEYSEGLKTILFNTNENKVIYISDISELKNIIDEYLEDGNSILSIAKERGIIEEYDVNKSIIIKDKMDSELELIKKDSEFFIPLVIDNDIEIFSLKKIFKITYKDFPSIEGNIQLFPFYNEKEKPFIEFMSDEFETKGSVKLYYARFHIDYLYFDIYFKIYYF